MYNFTPACVGSLFILSAFDVRRSESFILVSYYRDVLWRLYVSGCVEEESFNFLNSARDVDMSVRSIGSLVLLVNFDVC